MKKTYKTGLVALAALGAVMVFTKDTPQQKEAKYLRRGNELFDKGDYDKARLAYRNAAKISPTDPEIAYRWGLVDEAQGDIRNAFVDFTSAEQQNAHYYPALVKLAHYYLVSDQNEQAQKRVDILLADKPGDAEARALNAALLLRDKKYAEAENEAHFSLEKDPANITAFSVLTGMYTVRNDLKKAGEIVEEAIAKNPKDLSLLMLKATIYQKPINAQKIKEAYDVILLLKPADPQFRIYLSDIYVDANMYDEAEKTLRDGIAAIPDNWRLKRQLVTFLDTRRSFEAAEKQIKYYIGEFPKAADLYLWLSDLYIGHDKTDSAVSLLEDIIAKNNADLQSLNARTSLARIGFTKGDKITAEKIINAVLKKNPNNYEALFVRASIATDRGQYENAVSDLRAILRDKPRAKDALQLLAEVLAKQNYLDLAIETMNQLVDIDPGNPTVRSRLAQMYNANGDTKHVMEQLAIVTKTAPQFPLGWETVARLAIGAKDYPTAKAAIAKLDAIDGQHMTATYLEGQISAGNNHKEDSFASYASVIDADPSSALAEHALYSMVDEHHAPGELEKTTAYIASIKTDNPYVSTILGQCYMNLDKPELAKAAFDKAIAHRALTQDAYIGRASFYITDKHYDDAIALMKKAKDVAPVDIRAPLIEATLLRKQEKFDEAIAIYDELLKKDNKLNVAINNEAIVIADHQFDDEAKLEKAYQLAKVFSESDNPNLVDTLGWIYYRQKKLDKALTLLQKATEDPHAVPENSYHYGVALLASGDRVKAKDALIKATAPNADYEALGAAKKLMEGL